MAGSRCPNIVGLKAENFLRFRSYGDYDARYIGRTKHLHPSKMEVRIAMGIFERLVDAVVMCVAVNTEYRFMVT